MNIISKSISAPELKSERGFWIGDPGYVFPNKNWMSFCDESNKHSKKEVAEYDCEYGKFWEWETNYGDGEYDLKYSGKNVASLGVDAGMLSIIPAEAMEKMVADEDKGEKNLGYFIQGKCARLISFESGDIKISVDGKKVSIKTS